MNGIRFALFAAAFAACAPAFSLAPQIEQHSGVRYVSGGIGDEERADLEAMRKDFNLQMLFAVKRAGNYLAGVDVRVTDTNGNEILRTTSEEPFFLAQLAPGSYNVTATYDGRSYTRRVKVGEKTPVRLALYWDDPTALEGSRGIEPERDRESASRGR